ncbi:MAG TPA: hypothetical protein VEI97_17465 [bacterium]|nr:hypothetical protein [bacterium]
MPQALRRLPADVGVLLLTALALLLTLFLTQSQYLARWDSAQFALALDRVDVRAHQPHPPGYPWYVAVARWLRPIALGEANRAYLLVNWLLTFGGAWAVALLGHRWGGWRLGLAAAAVFLASPQTRYNTDVVLSYPAAACFFAWIGYAAWKVWAEGDRRWWWPFLLAGVGGAFRIPTLVLAIPVLLAVWWRLSAVRKVLAVLLVGGILAAAYVPIIQVSGGWEAYRAAAASEAVKHETRFSRFGRSPIAELFSNWRAMVDYLYLAFGLGAIMPLGLLALRSKRTPEPWLEPAEDPAVPWGRFLLWWALPAFVLYTLIHVNSPGVFLDLQAPLALLVTMGVAAINTRGAFVFVALALVLHLVARFATADGPKDQGLPLIRAVDHLMAVHTQDLPAAAPSASTLLMVGESFKQDGYYLPGYRVVWDKYLLRASGPVETPILTMKGHLLEPWVLEGSRVNGVTIRFLPFPEGTTALACDPAALSSLYPEQVPWAQPVSERGKQSLVLIPVEGKSGIVMSPEMGWWIVQDAHERKAAEDALAALAQMRR